MLAALQNIERPTCAQRFFTVAMLVSSRGGVSWLLAKLSSALIFFFAPSAKGICRVNGEHVYGDAADEVMEDHGSCAGVKYVRGGTFRTIIWWCVEDAVFWDQSSPWWSSVKERGCNVPWLGWIMRFFFNSWAYSGDSEKLVIIGAFCDFRNWFNSRFFVGWSNEN